MEPVTIISVVTEKYSIFSEDQCDLPSDSPQFCRFAHSEAQLPRSTQSQANRDGWVL